MNTAVYQAATNEWCKNFWFLEKTGLHNVYLTILAAARSRRDISRWHQQLPDNQRVFNQELSLLRDFWEEYIKPDQQEALIWILDRQAEEVGDGRFIKNNTHHYFNHIQAHSTAPDKWPFGLQNLENTIKLYAQAGTEERYRSFTQLLDKAHQQAHEFEIKFYLAQRDKKEKIPDTIFIRLITQKSLLTEPLAYLIAGLPSYFMLPGAASPKFPEINLLFFFQDKALLDKVIWHSPTSCDVGPEFYAELETEARDRGLPLGHIIDVEN
jgi:hypothetical protein